MIRTFARSFILCNIQRVQIVDFPSLPLQFLCPTSLIDYHLHADNKPQPSGKCIKFIMEPEQEITKAAGTSVRIEESGPPNVFSNLFSENEPVHKDVTATTDHRTTEYPPGKKTKTQYDPQQKSDNECSVVKKKAYARKPKVLKKTDLEKVTNFVREHRNVAVAGQDLLHTADIQPSMSIQESQDTSLASRGEMNSVRSSECEDQPLLKILMSEVPDSDTDTLNETDVSQTRKEGKASKKRKRKFNSSKDDSQKGDGSKEAKKNRPNYFVAIQVNNPVVHKGLGMVQEHIVKQEPELLAARIPLPTLHLTLCVMYLQKSDIDSAASALEMCNVKLSHLREDPLVLNIAGIANFQNNVVFAKVKEGQELERLTSTADCVSGCFTERGLLSGNDKGFKPHLTLFKLSKSYNLRRKGIRRIDPSLYSEVKEIDFGPQTVRSLQLCAMLKPKDAGGYYHTEHAVYFVPDTYTEYDGMCFSDQSTSPISAISRLLVSEAITTAIHHLRQEMLDKICQSKASELSTHRTRVTKGHQRSGYNHHSSQSSNTRDAQSFIVQLQKDLLWKFKIDMEPRSSNILKMLKNYS